MLTNKTLLRPPLKCWDIYAMFLVEQAKTFNKQTEIALLNAYKKKYDWVFDVEQILENTDFEALVLTDAGQEILWVNKGFTKMTGYPANFAKGKKPNFLQGKASKTNNSLLNIRENLKKGIHFKETIINYRKNGEIYNCAIEIYPLKDAANNIQHLLALEKEIEL